MNRRLRQKLEKLRADHEAVTGRPFSHFFCPILFRDEEADLCEGHVVNNAFPGSSRVSTVQRQDVDSFYGAHFEAEFVNIQHRGSVTGADAITDHELTKKLKPAFLLNSKPIEYYTPKHGSKVPEDFTPIEFEHGNRSVKLVLKIKPQEVLEASDESWDIALSKDVRIHALVSLIKSAHLTLFRLLGYQYAFSAGGHFVGNDILGKFFLQNQGRPKAEVVEAAIDFFAEFVHMVRPIMSNPSSKSESVPRPGTVADRTLMVCRFGHGAFWALIVFVQTGHGLHAVLVPVFDDPEGAVRFVDFLRNDNEYIESSYCKIEDNHWQVEKKTKDISWPKTNASLVDRV